METRHLGCRCPEREPAVRTPGSPELWGVMQPARRHAVPFTSPGEMVMGMGFFLTPWNFPGGEKQRRDPAALQGAGTALRLYSAMHTGPRCWIPGVWPTCHGVAPWVVAVTVTCPLPWVQLSALPQGPGTSCSLG